MASLFFPINKIQYTSVLRETSQRFYSNKEPFKNTKIAYTQRVYLHLIIFCLAGLKHVNSCTGMNVIKGKFSLQIRYFRSTCNGYK